MAMIRNPESLEIRRAIAVDADEIARLTTELGYAATAKETASRLGALLARPGHFIAVAPANNARLLGWVCAERRLLMELGERMEISGLMVSADGRRGGVGRALVSAAEAWAAGLGLATVAVRSNIVRAESHPFYLAMGYAREKTQHVYAKAMVTD
jgi:GNAT superfamily N-acetyltransferase